MLDLCGAPLVGRVLERVLRANNISELVLAIPDTPDNVILGDLAHEYGVTVFRGSENNLLDRYYQCALKLNADYIVRIPADNPLSEPEEIDKVIQHHIACNHQGFTSNLAEVFDSGYPDGIGAEVFSMQSLSEVWLTETDSRKLEHVHLNFFDYVTQTAANPAKYPVGTIICPSEFARPDIILDINGWPDYRHIRNIYKSLYKNNAKFGIKEIIDLLDELSTTETDQNG